MIKVILYTFLHIFKTCMQVSSTDMHLRSECYFFEIFMMYFVLGGRGGSGGFGGRGGGGFGGSKLILL